MKTTLHYVFTQSGAGCLVQALRKAGRSDPVIVMYDDLSFGPINSSDRDVRTKWVADELGEPRWINTCTGPERVSSDASAPDNRKVLWLTRRSAMEYAGFLDELSRLGDAACDVVDLSEVTVPTEPGQDISRPRRLLLSVGMLHHDVICREKLWELAEPLQDAVRKRYQSLWQQLVAENAPLRIIKDGVLVSAPISHFDSRLIAQVTSKWQNAWRVVGHTLVSGPDDLIEYGHTFVMGRMRALVKSGQLEVRGELRDEVRDSQIRLCKTR